MSPQRSRRLIACMLSSVALASVAVADIQLRHTVTGEVLSLNDALPEGRDTPAVQYFLQTGRDPYVEVEDCLPKAKDLYLSACSGCHGHLAEGKIGPGLNDNYWTYPKNTTDQGLFETLYGGARAQMGPQTLSLTLDDMLLVMAWVRHVYTGSPSEAEWLTSEQRKQFKSYVESKDRVQPSNNPAPACKPVFN